MDLELWRKTKKERNLTYQDIANQSGLPLGTIKNIFAGYTPDPRESTIRAIEQALGVETHLIHVYHNNSPYSNEEQALIESYRKLPDDLQERARMYMQKLLELIADEKQTVFTVKENRSKKSS